MKRPHDAKAIANKIDARCIKPDGTNKLTLYNGLVGFQNIKGVSFVLVVKIFKATSISVNSVMMSYGLELRDL